MNDLIINNVPDLPAIAKSLSGVSDRTKEAYASAMCSYNNYCMESDKQMNLDSLKQWIQSANKPSTQALRTAAARKIFGQLYKGHPQLQELKEAIAEIKVVKVDQSVKESEYLTQEEVDKLLAVASPKMGAMIKTLYMTGLRISELLNMRYDHCKPIREGEVFEVTIIGKRNKENTVYISKALMYEINSLFDNTEYLFEHEGQQYNRKYVSNEIARLGRLIGKDISAHSLRHSFAYRLMQKGVSIDKVSKSLNHASITTTANFYLHEKASLEDLGVI
jgi:integrase/recombinase XerD